MSTCRPRAPCRVAVGRSIKVKGSGTLEKLSTSEEEVAIFLGAEALSEFREAWESTLGACPLLLCMRGQAHPAVLCTVLFGL